MNINLYINKQSVKAEAPEIFSGSVGVLTVTLFGELDTSLIPVLRFMHESGEEYYTAKTENGTAIVPHEVIHSPGFTIAVAGYENEGDEIKRFLPSGAAYIPVKENGYGSPDAAMSEEEDAQSLIGQILTECGEVKSALLNEQAERQAADGDLQTELDLETAARKTGDDTVLEILEAEQEARQTADEALRLRISEEEEARSTTDAELREFISKKVSKEDGKGLSAILNIDHSKWASADGSLGGNAAGSVVDNYHELIITHQSGTEDSISIYDTEQTCAVIDEKLSKFKPSDNVDLSGYVKKEQDRGLSEVSTVTFPWYFAQNDDGTETEYTGIKVEYFRDNGENFEDEIFIYPKDIIDTKLGKTIVDNNSRCQLSLTSNAKIICGEILELAIYENSLILGEETYCTFTSGTTATVINDDEFVPKEIIKWIGDDCNAEGRFTPTANTSYEVSFIQLPNIVIARVGAC